MCRSVVKLKSYKSYMRHHSNARESVLETLYDPFREKVFPRPQPFSFNSEYYQHPHFRRIQLCRHRRGCSVLKYTSKWRIAREKNAFEEDERMVHHMPSWKRYASYEEDQKFYGDMAQQIKSLTNDGEINRFEEEEEDIFSRQVKEYIYELSPERKSYKLSQREGAKTRWNEDSNICKLERNEKSISREHDNRTMNENINNSHCSYKNTKTQHHSHYGVTTPRYYNKGMDRSSRNRYESNYSVRDRWQNETRDLHREYRVAESNGSRETFRSPYREITKPREKHLKRYRDEASVDYENTREETYHYKEGKDSRETENFRPKEIENTSNKNICQRGRIPMKEEEKPSRGKDGQVKVVKVSQVKGEKVDQVKGEKDGQVKVVKVAQVKGGKVAQVKGEKDGQVKVVKVAQVKGGKVAQVKAV
uniref:(California timema) hypothetical protein n=1 Tax=Timema californicum TaxID=61474 RepID=A0A7R9J5E3_TIMCA|nr:unnamed protein product [Timema californicum]